MDNFLNNDWPKAEERFRAFWNRELIDRCCISLRGQRKDAPPIVWPKAPEDHAGLKKYWLDPEFNLQWRRKCFSSTCFVGEAYPASTMCLGASAMAEFFGAKSEFKPETVWFHPVITDIVSHEWPADTSATPLYKATYGMTRNYVEKNNGEFFVGMPELGSATDNLSLLRGMQELLLDMIDSPEAVKAAIRRLVAAWQVEHGRLFELTRKCNAGGCCIPWMQIWAPGPCYQMSCDFSAIMSPEMFREFFLPEIEAYLDVNEYGVYHLDGPDELKHLDALLSLPRLKAIQWTQGAGQAPKSNPRWIPYYRRIQEAGKCLILPEVAPEEVETILGLISSRGLFLWSWCGEDEAGAMLKNIHRWTRD